MGRSVLILVAAVLLCGLVLLFPGGRSFPPGPCSSVLDLGIGEFFEEESAEPISGEVKELLEDPNFEASRKAEGDLEAGIVDPRLVSTLHTVTAEHHICVDAFKEGHYFIRGVEEGPLIPESYGEAGGLPNTHYYGRAADIREVDGKPVRGNGDDPNVLGVGEVLAAIPPQQRPDQIIGPPVWTEALGRSRGEGWVLDEDQLELHEGHLHIGYRSEVSTSNTE